MTKTIKICDKCNKEVEWLYKVPHICVMGLNLKVDNEPLRNATELCKDCMQQLIDIIETFPTNKDEGKSSC
jgi:hypothetical protein